MQNWNYYWAKYKYYIIGLGLLFLFLFFIGVWLFSKKEAPPIEIEPPVLEEPVKEDKTIQIDLKGAVEKPGVYTLAVGSRVAEAIEKSGGLRADANTETINLSKTLEDQMVIIIYTKAEIEEMKKGVTGVKIVDQVCECPKIENNACIENKVTNEGTKPPIQGETPKGKVSLNRATQKELETLTGIGESKAKLIIAYREANGGFRSIEELKKVKGIGDATYEKIKNEITL